MSEQRYIEGYAIISADGMLADSNLVIPPGLVVPADQEFFHGRLKDAAVVVQGRNSHEGGEAATGRRRLVVTSRVAQLAPHPDYPNAFLWNPRGATLDEACAAVGAGPGICAIIGGGSVYSLFLEIGYDAFHLTRAPRVYLPGGRPVFESVSSGRTPEEELAARGLEPGAPQLLDTQAHVTLVTWRRRQIPAVEWHARQLRAS